MKLIVLGPALAAMVACCFPSAAHADTISVVGYTNDIIYNDQHYKPDGSISATFYFEFNGTYDEVNGADVFFSITGKQYDFGIPDDGYGQATVDGNGFSAFASYLTGTYDRAAGVQFSSASNPIFEGVSYTLKPADIGSFSAIATYSDPINDIYSTQLEIIFRPVAVSLNGVAAVPLGASAPLFGFALAILGVIGLGDRRLRTRAQDCATLT